MPAPRRTHAISGRVARAVVRARWVVVALWLAASVYVAIALPTSRSGT
jgi:uncharacterized membrane protein YdfJ with MMPL/SSD domain